LVLNKVLPELFLDRDATTVAKTLAHHSAEVAADVGARIGPPADDERLLTTVLGEVGESFLNYQVVARREAEQRAELARIPQLTATVPYFDDDIHSLGGLLRLGERIWS
ncbi:MAG TPA: hypothetical protein P5193_10300, partial [Microthrixaceae bacterium]|nr:hypothetical protein [Microthrixaceae bacterium]